MFSSLSSVLAVMLLLLSLSSSNGASNQSETCRIEEPEICYNSKGNIADWFKITAVSIAIATVQYTVVWHKEDKKWQLDIIKVFLS